MGLESLYLMWSMGCLFVCLSAHFLSFLFLSFSLSHYFLCIHFGSGIADILEG